MCSNRIQHSQNVTFIEDSDCLPVPDNNDEPNTGTKNNDATPTKTNNRTEPILIQDDVIKGPERINPPAMNEEPH